MIKVDIILKDGQRVKGEFVEIKDNAVLLKNCEEVKNQIYDQVICHRIRDIFIPIRVLLAVVLCRIILIVYFMYSNACIFISI